MHTNIKSIFILSAILLSPIAMFAAESAAADNGGNAMNPMLIGLVSLMVILLFVIGVLTHVLRQLAAVYSEKIKSERKSGGQIVKSLLLLALLSLGGYQVMAAEAEAVTAAAAPVSTIIDGIPKTDFYLLMSFITLELIIIFTLIIVVRVMIKQIRNKPELVAVAAEQKSFFWDKFNKSVSIEKEKDILLDHDYDGIHELDNSLPPWWLYGFYLTIIVGVIYLYRYQVSGDGPSQEQEYVTEMEQAEEAKAAYLAKSANNVDENTVKYLNNPSDLGAGGAIFQTVCAACHLKDGGGSVGPNLTDEYWIHGGSISDIFKTIKYGWQDKGMKSWKDDYSPMQIAQISSYVKSLQGTHPAAPKEKQGELYIEAGAPAANKDSASATSSADTTQKK